MHLAPRHRAIPFSPTLEVPSFGMRSKPYTELGGGTPGISPPPAFFLATRDAPNLCCQFRQICSDHCFDGKLSNSRWLITIARTRRDEPSLTSRSIPGLTPSLTQRPQLDRGQKLLLSGRICERIQRHIPRNGSDLKRFIVNLSTSSKLNNMLKDNLTGALTLTETLNNYVDRW